MPSRKPDYSRLVLLPALTPTEAAILKGMLLKLQHQAEMPPECELVSLLLRDSISLQLKAIAWPEDRRKAPYPA